MLLYMNNTHKINVKIDIITHLIDKSVVKQAKKLHSTPLTRCHLRQGRNLLMTMKVIGSRTFAK